MLLRCSLLCLLASLSMHGACASPPAGTAGAVTSAGVAGDGADARKAARAQLEELASAASAYTFANDRCPQSLDDLLHPPSGEPLIASMPRDPWGQPVALMPISEDSPGNAFVSGGPDGQLLTDDDISVRAACSER